MPFKPTKPSSPEEEYFAREEALKKQKLSIEQAKKLQEKQREELRAMHWMHCPKCGMELQTISFRDVEIDRCFNCNGVWLDDGELEKLASHEKETKGAIVRSVLRIFGEPRPKTKPRK
jgi:Zn-finger nucleic acid-binding protein